MAQFEIFKIDLGFSAGKKKAAEIDRGISDTLKGLGSKIGIGATKAKAKANEGAAKVNEGAATVTDEVKAQAVTSSNPAIDALIKAKLAQHGAIAEAAKERGIDPKEITFDQHGDVNDTRLTADKTLKAKLDSLTEGTRRATGDVVKGIYDSAESLGSVALRGKAALTDQRVNLALKAKKLPELLANPLSVESVVKSRIDTQAMIDAIGPAPAAAAAEKDKPRPSIEIVRRDGPT